MMGFQFLTKTDKVRPEDKYQKRIVAFLDILGFRDLICNPKNNLFFKTFFQTIHKMNAIATPEMHLTGVQYTSISDSIVISVPYGKGAFTKLMRSVEILAMVCLENKILLRGGIAIGELYHEENVVFGPALVEAYLLEKRYCHLSAYCY